MSERLVEDKIWDILTMFEDGDIQQFDAVQSIIGIMESEKAIPRRVERLEQELDIIHDKVRMIWEKIMRA